MDCLFFKITILNPPNNEKPLSFTLDPRYCRNKCWETFLIFKWVLPKYQLSNSQIPLIHSFQIQNYPMNEFRTTTIKAKLFVAKHTIISFVPTKVFCQSIWQHRNQYAFGFNSLECHLLCISCFSWLSDQPGRLL